MKCKCATHSIPTILLLIRIFLHFEIKERDPYSKYKPFPHLNIIWTDVDLSLLAPVRGRVDHHPALGPGQLVGEAQGDDLGSDLSEGKTSF